MDADLRKRAAKRALQSIRREAGRASLGDRLPEERRAKPEFMISIGLGERGEEEGGKKPDDDPDSEDHGYAFDDDPEMPGRSRRRQR